MQEFGGHLCPTIHQYDLSIAGGKCGQCPSGLEQQILNVNSDAYLNIKYAYPEAVDQCGMVVNICG